MILMKQAIEFNLNGKSTSVEASPMARLLDVLREECGATGTKEGCGEGECGACSIFIDGVLVNSCLVPALQIQGKELVTIEGVENLPDHKDLQNAFITEGGAQCGICTPGMVMAAVDLLRKKPDPNLEDIKDGLAGNLCRCTGYMRIFESVIKVVKEGGLK